MIIIVQCKLMYELHKSPKCVGLRYISPYLRTCTDAVCPHPSSPVHGACAPTWGGSPAGRPLARILAGYPRWKNHWNRERIYYTESVLEPVGMFASFLHSWRGLPSEAYVWLPRALMMDRNVAKNEKFESVLENCRTHG